MTDAWIPRVPLAWHQALQVALRRRAGLSVQGWPAAPEAGGLTWLRQHVAALQRWGQAVQIGAACGELRVAQAQQDLCNAQLCDWQF